MLQPGQFATVLIEKPAAGGRMIARVSGQVVLVSGAIPGERVQAQVERVGKGVTYATTVTVEEPSADRVAVAADPQCGGCLYAHIDYDRQLEIKSLIVADAFARIARLPLQAPVAVTPSPIDGYRARTRLHRRGGRLGFFREGTHELCEVRQTRQLLPATCDIVDRLANDLARVVPDVVEEVEIVENLDASERVVHLHAAAAAASRLASRAGAISLEAVTGLTMSGADGRCHVLAGSPHVSDRVELDARLLPASETAVAIAVRRHVLAFFQGNRFLLTALAAHVVEQVPVGSTAIDLYAGGGLFALAAARARQAHVTAVEGDRVGADDLIANAGSTDGRVEALHQSVEMFLRSASPGAEVAIVDPPRTGLSREALDGVVRLHPGRVIYVSCDVATLARDARRLGEGGYQMASVKGFDLFPMTPHVECVVVFEK